MEPGFPRRLGPRIPNDLQPLDYLEAMAYQDRQLADLEAEFRLVMDRLDLLAQLIARRKQRK